MKNSKLFEKIVLNNKVEIKNRIAIAPITLYASNPDGSMTDEEREYLKVRGTDIGIYIFGASYVSKEGMTSNDFHFSISEKEVDEITQHTAEKIKQQAERIKLNRAGERRSDYLEHNEQRHKQHRLGEQLVAQLLKQKRGVVAYGL